MHKYILDLHIEIYKGRKVWTDLEDEKNEELSGVIDAAPGVHCRAQPRQGRNQVVAAIPFSWEVQKDLLNIPE